MAERTKGDGLGKTGGRQKGTENKTTRSMKALVAEFADDKDRQSVDALFTRLFEIKDKI